MPKGLIFLLSLFQICRNTKQWWVSRTAPEKLHFASKILLRVIQLACSAVA